MRLTSYVPGELIPLPLSGSIPELPHVAKVENRATRKISQKLIFSRLHHCSTAGWRYLKKIIQGCRRRTVSFVFR